MARDYRKTDRKLEPGEPLQPEVWYRSAWYTLDHLAGQSPAWMEEEIAYCGRPLGALRDWEDNEIGGLYESSRTSGRCGPCSTRNKEQKGDYGQ